MSIVIIVLIAVLVLAGIIGIWWISAYNSLIALANRVDASWANMDTQLKRRSDLIPNLLESVKGYMSHERETLESVIAARSAVTAAKDPAAAAQADTALSGALRQLFALSQNYPQLRANENFLQLQNELTATENAIAGTRQQYNSSVQDLNTRREIFPVSIVAGNKPKFAARQYFEVKDEAAREVPKISF